MNTELKNHHKATIHQAILESCADLLDNEDVVYHQLHLGVSDPVIREESELHIRMADAAYSEYEKTMFGESESIDTSELLKQNNEMREMLVTISSALEHIWMNNDSNEVFDVINAEELDKLIESITPKN